MNEDLKQVPTEAHLESPIDYEIAEEIIEQERPAVLKEIDAHDPDRRKKLKEAILSAVSIRLLDEGVTLPVSRAHADNGEGLNPMVMKTLKEWKQYIYEATLQVLNYR